MIITCASCLTKFNLDDARIQTKGVKVRCSRCKHVFYVVPPPETKEEIIEGFESFAKYHEGLMGPGEKKLEASPEPKGKKEEVVPEAEEEAFLFSEKAPVKKTEKFVSPEKREEPAPAEKVETWAAPEEEEKTPFEEPVQTERAKDTPSRRRSALRVERKGPSRFLALVVVFILLVFGIFYVWSELSSGGRLSPYFEYPVKKITELWSQIWGIEKEDLVVGDLNRYDEKVGEIPLSIIEGKVKNQSQHTKEYIKVKVMIFDRDRFKVAEKEAICGRVISREELKKQPVEFFQGEMVIKPQTKEEMVTPPGKTTPFMVILKDPPSQAKEFKVDIVEAPNLSN
ncbi:MAG: DUF3426 domain-containing protein [Thermodesulfobacteriota bacterium]